MGTRAHGGSFPDAITRCAELLEGDLERIEGDAAVGAPVRHARDRDRTDDGGCGGLE
ncbi:hypothetical protein [Nakamurella leprariae]|uniref:Uncharacterized protein n=1 Tax=Nakamurella leprariae TaxID=2803911 RepID=A0A939BXE5_9ACTN|nr:hypothetical protein [Nakamurella leprariae]MBM9465895.1 hypothetical protein [Nakamurella leprariae]